MADGHTYYGTTLRNVRVDQKLWDAAKAKALEEGISVSDRIRDDLVRWIS